MKLNTIISQDNQQLKNLKKLTLKKNRDTAEVFVVENLRTIADALKAGIKPKAIYLTEGALNLADKRMELIKNEMAEINIITAPMNESASDLSTASGIMAIYDKPESTLDLTTDTVYLNGVSDPGNLGTIMRSALAFGFKNVVADETCADFFNAKTLSASKDAIFKLNLIHDNVLIHLKKLSTTHDLFACAGNGTELKKNKRGKKPLVLIFGNEANGITPAVLKLAGTVISIPISEDMESLNVAVAAGIILYHFAS